MSNFVKLLWPPPLSSPLVGEGVTFRCFNFSHVSETRGVLRTRNLIVDRGEMKNNLMIRSLKSYKKLFSN